MLAEHRPWKTEKDFRVEVARGRMTCCEDVMLAKPQTFMNASGQAVVSLLHYYKLAASDLLVIHDEIDIPLGDLRLSYDASAGGHNGVQSVIDALGTKQFWRLRIGIGPQVGVSENFVLNNFGKSELPLLHHAMERALKGIEEMFTAGPAKAQTDLNKKEK